MTLHNPTPALLRTRGADGETNAECQIIGETPANYRLRMLEPVRLRRRGYIGRGTIVLARKEHVHVG